MDHYEPFIPLNNQQAKVMMPKNKPITQSQDKLSKALQRNLIRRKNAKQKTTTQDDGANVNPDNFSI